MDLISASLHAILDQLNDGVYIVDTDRRITYWNRAAERITGYRREQVVGQCCAANILMHVNDSGEQLCAAMCPLAVTLQDGQTREAQVFLHHASGHRVPVAVRVVPVFEDNGNEPSLPNARRITGVVEVFSENISLASAILRIEELQREAMLDPLTGIGNRRMTQSRLALTLAEWEQHHLPFGLLMVDVDHFKLVNDTYGHDAGDRALKMVASSLSSGLRSYDFLGRWGGEEFLAIVANVDRQELGVVAERMRMLVETSLVFLDPGDRRMERAMRVTVSMGGALVRPGEGLETLLDRADKNLYRSKGGGRNKVIIDGD